MTATKDALLDSAEELFALHGIEATSLRAITRGAAANLAAVNYHFGSKEGLIEAVLDRRLGPLTEHRFALLTRYESQSGPEGPSLEQVVRAFVQPAMELEGRAKSLAALMARLPFEYDIKVQRIFKEAIEETFERFSSAFARCLPELERAQLVWRLHFAAGAMAAAITRPEMFRMLAPNESAEPEQTLDRLVRFIVGGFRAPASEGGFEVNRSREVAVGAQESRP